MKRTRYQKGTLQVRVQGGIKKWIGHYRDEDNIKRAFTIGQFSKITRAGAQQKLDERVARVNTKDIADPTLAEFIASAYFPHKRRTWKGSTKGTTEQRINTHLVGDLGGKHITELRRELMAQYLEEKAKLGKSHSVIAHLRWDLKAILDLAVADGIVLTNQAIALAVPKVLNVVSKVTATPQQGMRVIVALDIKERLISRLALYVGLRPGEILATQWHDWAGDQMRVERRVYKGIVDTVKNQIPRIAALPESVVRDMKRWAELSFDLRPDAYIFATRTGGPGNRDSIWRHGMKKPLKAIHLDWITPQVMRRTWASISAGAGIDPKVRADQLGHGVDVDINQYVQTPFAGKLAAVKAVEKLLTQGLENAVPEGEIQ